MLIYKLRILLSSHFVSHSLSISQSETTGCYRSHSLLLKLCDLRFGFRQGSFQILEGLRLVSKRQKHMFDKKYGESLLPTSRTLKTSQPPRPTKNRLSLAQELNEPLLVTSYSMPVAQQIQVAKSLALQLWHTFFMRIFSFVALTTAMVVGIGCALPVAKIGAT